MDATNQGIAPDGPVVPGERIEAIDVLRGVALLGILLMNIEEFSAPNTGLADVLDARSPFDADRLTWLTVAVLFEGKMRGLFSMLFGAGVVLLTSRAERRGDLTKVADIYYRRTLWLLAFGLFHAYFVWAGDILYDYAVAGLLLYPLRNLSPRVLIAAGLVALAVIVPKEVLQARHLERVRKVAAGAEVAEARGESLTKDQRQAIDEWKDEIKDVRPAPEDVAEQVAAHRGGYWALFRHRAEEVVRIESRDFYTEGVWDTVGMMLIGMGLLKSGFLSGVMSPRAYLAAAAIGLGLGWSLAGLMVGWVVVHRGDPVAVHQAGALYEPGRLAASVGYAGLVNWAFRIGLFPGLSARLAAVGRMALTHYLATSLVCTLLFNGYGFGLYGHLRRHQTYAVVLAVWAVQLLAGPIWLRHFRFGPAEWLWRSLTYLRRQPLRWVEPAPDD